MLVQRAILSGEPPSSLKQDIKRITDSLSACLAHHGATELTHFLVWKRTTRTSQSSSFAGRVSDKEFPARTPRSQRDSCGYGLVNPAVLAVTELGEGPRRLRSNRNRVLLPSWPNLEPAAGFKTLYRAARRYLPTGPTSITKGRTPSILLQITEYSLRTNLP
jgi:hypothetical protein